MVESEFIQVFRAVSLVKHENAMTPFGVCSRDVMFYLVFLFRFKQKLTFS